MKYLLLIYNNAAFINTLPETERDAIFGDVDAIMKELEGSGELIGGQALADVSTTKTVQRRHGVVTATDGPFLEAKEHLAGYLMVEVESEERAVQIAGRWPDAAFGAMEVRAIMNTSGLEM